MNFDIDCLLAHPEYHPGEDTGGNKHSEAFKYLFSLAAELSSQKIDCGTGNQTAQDCQWNSKPDRFKALAVVGPGQIGKDNPDDEGGFQPFPQCN